MKNDLSEAVLFVPGELGHPHSLFEDLGPTIAPDVFFPMMRAPVLSVPPPMRFGPSIDFLQVPFSTQTIVQSKEAIQ